ncbi:16S rRNA (cytosine967-C5)-methyltransferase [Arcanobacterium pluranimalium]|uniref:transcription antitermination factor NusB n=1 Tax=Arcanobacterium pluranimalium TaxID=108028 RepID=UPI00195F0791|nr:transcription antitermination factor NusB [Arcanobacterium pluranimalium]MBM7825429.1 16S rRNA (cytosine967-C5)-methyltransferase [Arcanobacterium pluranimalium]
MSNSQPKNWRPGRSSSDPAREVVFETLLAVAQDDAYANLELPKAIRRARLNKQDAAYATNLCYGTLRFQGRWDAIIAHGTAGRNLDTLDLPVLVLLRMGTHQLLGFETPAHAAIYETVKLARNLLGSGASGFINAVLRRVSERTLAQWQAVLHQDFGGKTSSLGFIATWFSHPEWIVRVIAKSLLANGRTNKDVISVLKADNEPADVSLVAREISIADLTRDIERGHMHCSAGKLVDSAVLLRGGDPHRVFAVQDLKAGVQDEGSQLVARTFARAPIAGKDELWLDMCAGPGGKTATLAAIAAQRGVKVHANEPHEHRLDLVHNAVEPWDDIVALRLGDGRDIGELEPLAYDRVLVDAPCTGIGALRRRPEARWRKAAGDAVDLTHLQLELLESAWKAVRAGGIVAYSTCSPHVAETHDVIEAFLAAHADADLLDAPAIAAAEAKIGNLGQNRQIQLWPDLHFSDAMYMAIIHKSEASES